MKDIQIPVLSKTFSEDIHVLDDKAVKSATFFNFDTYSKALTRIICSKDTKTPLVIGIFGEWGSGKTSLMRTMEKNIQEIEGSNIKTIWFDAWKFDKEDAIWRVLLMRILDELKTKGENEEEKKLNKDLDDLQTSLYVEVKREELGALTFDLVKATRGTVNLAISRLLGGIKSEDVMALFESVFRTKKEINLQKVQLLEQFDSMFNGIIQKYYVSNGKMVVIFIDDLDRCLPEKALDVLEAIKLFLDVKGCIFILGIDRRVISSIVHEKFKKLIYEGEKEEDISITGENYIEKIIQLSFQLPPIQPDDMEEFIDSLKSEGIELEFYRPYMPMIIAGIEPNPRKIKRFFNLVELQRSLAWAIFSKKDFDKSEKIILDAMMIEWSIISSNHPKFRDAALKKKSILVGMHYYLGSEALEEAPKEPPAELNPFLGNERLNNLIREFQNYINGQDKIEEKLKLKETLKAKLDYIIDQVVHLSHVAGVENIEEAPKRVEEGEEGARPISIEEVRKAIEENKPLMGMDLQKLDLEEMDLSSMMLNGANLARAKLKNAENANLNGAILLVADLRGANLKGAYLVRANLNSANLEHADLTGAHLKGATMVRAKLNSAVLNNTDLTHAKLNNAKLWHAKLRETNLSDSSLKDAELYSADLSSADLTNADLYNAGLMGAHMEGAKMNGTSLRHCNLKGAIFDNKTDFRKADIDSVTIDNLEDSNWKDATWDPDMFEEIKKKYEGT